MFAAPYDPGNRKSRRVAKFKKITMDDKIQVMRVLKIQVFKERLQPSLFKWVLNGMSCFRYQRGTSVIDPKNKVLLAQIKMCCSNSILYMLE